MYHHPVLVKYYYQDRIQALVLVLPSRCVADSRDCVEHLHALVLLLFHTIAGPDNRLV